MTEMTELFVYIAFMGLLLLFAIISNIFVIVSVAKFKKLRSVTNVLIGNLSVADILLAGVFVPQKLHDMSHPEDYNEGNIQCKVINFIPIFLITSSCYTLVCVSFERRRAIMNSNKPQMTLKQLWRVIPVIWIAAFAISTPTLFEYSTNTIEKFVSHNVTHVHDSCGNTKMPRAFVLTNGCFVLIISFLIPLVLVFQNYICLARFVSRKTRQVVSDSSKVATVTTGPSSFHVVSHLHKNRIKLMQMLVLVAVVFAVSWVPYFVLFMYMKITGKDASKDAASAVGQLLIAMATISTAYNVVLYVIFNNNFREAFKKILKCNWTDLPPHRHSIEHR